MGSRTRSPEVPARCTGCPGGITGQLTQRLQSESGSGTCAGEHKTETNTELGLWASDRSRATELQEAPEGLWRQGADGGSVPGSLGYRGS